MLCCHASALGCLRNLCHIHGHPSRWTARKSRIWSISPPRKIGIVGAILNLFGPCRKWHDLEVFFSPIQTLPPFWVTWMWIWRTYIFELFLENFYFWVVFGFQISGCPGFQISKIWPGPGLGLGRACAWAFGHAGPRVGSKWADVVLPCLHLEISDLIKQ